MQTGFNCGWRKLFRLLFSDAGTLASSAQAFQGKWVDESRAFDLAPKYLHLNFPPRSIAGGGHLPSSSAMDPSRERADRLAIDRAENEGMPGCYGQRPSCSAQPGTAR